MHEAFKRGNHANEDKKICSSAASPLWPAWPIWTPTIVGAYEQVKGNDDDDETDEQKSIRLSLLPFSVYPNSEEDL